MALKCQVAHPSLDFIVELKAIFEEKYQTWVKSVSSGYVGYKMRYKQVCWIEIQGVKE